MINELISKFKKGNNMTEKTDTLWYEHAFEFTVETYLKLGYKSFKLGEGVDLAKEAVNECEKLYPTSDVKYVIDVNDKMRRWVVLYKIKDVV
ncbi:MAG: hypothetical protein M0R51_11945 [Clostridia bacterium]|jgi:hypothetical protein|nr:hypothetical protein [Clostridia bacterium]